MPVDILIESNILSIIQNVKKLSFKLSFYIYGHTFSYAPEPGV